MRTRGLSEPARHYLCVVPQATGIGRKHGGRQRGAQRACQRGWQGGPRQDVPKHRIARPRHKHIPRVLLPCSRAPGNTSAERLCDMCLQGGWLESDQDIPGPGFARPRQT